eukprot:3536168-Pyramimonas_sp.AAC.1
MAVEQALKEHVSTSAPSLETHIISQFPPGLAPSEAAKQAEAMQLDHDEADKRSQGMKRVGEAIDQ